MLEGKKIRRMPLTNPASVKAASDWLYAGRFLYPLPLRKAAALAILRKAAAFDGQAARGEAPARHTAGPSAGPTRFEPEVLAYMEKAAGLGSADPQAVAEKVAQRVLMLKGSRFNGHKQALGELALHLSDQDRLTPAQFQKVAAAVDAADRETGLCDEYVHGVELPEEFCFTVLEKDAEDAADNFVTLTTGNSWPVESFLTLPLEKIAEVLGGDFTGHVTGADGEVDPVKFADVARTLPRDDAVLLERAMRAAVKSAALGMQKEARASKQSRQSFGKDDLIARLRKEGRQVVNADQDFRLTARLA
jgi:hypothetical protein